jgi:glycosyltransferase involved in cell wall biosynthesis
MARALRAVGADVRIYCPYRGEYYESKLVAQNIPVIWLGACANGAVRFLRLAAKLLRFRPHVIQSAHFHMNLAANLLGRALGAVYLASSRSDIAREIEACKPLGIWGIRTAARLIANSKASKETAIRLGIPAEKVLVLPNVIDLQEFDRARAGTNASSEDIWAAAVGTLSDNKRFDQFLLAIARARREEPRLHGFLAGDGPARGSLETLALSLGLGKDRFQFLGRRNDVPALLQKADVFVMSSRYEGCPNVLLEAMAGRLPIITTPAGDADEMVEVAQSGFVVPHDDASALAARLALLGRTPELRAKMGANGRKFVEAHHDVGQLATRLMQIYRVVAGALDNTRVQALRACPVTSNQ